jgi:hypothetical protein
VLFNSLLGVKPTKRDFAGGWWWVLPAAQDAREPAEDAQDAQDAQQNVEGTLGTLGHLPGAGDDAEVM